MDEFLFLSPLTESFYGNLSKPTIEPVAKVPTKTKLRANGNTTSFGSIKSPMNYSTEEHISDCITPFSPTITPKNKSDVDNNNSSILGKKRKSHYGGS